MTRQDRDDKKEHHRVKAASGLDYVEPLVWKQGDCPQRLTPRVGTNPGKEGFMMEARPVSHSAVTMSELILPHHAGRAGVAHGGEIMKLMDTAAGVVAVRHSHKDSVTARVEGINFYHPIWVHNLVIVNASLTFVGRTSMEVRVEVWAEDIPKEEKVHALTAYFIMVAVDEAGRPTEVPPLSISTDREKELWEKGKQRYQMCKGDLMSGEASYKVCREEPVA